MASQTTPIALGWLKEKVERRADASFRSRNPSPRSIPVGGYQRFALHRRLKTKSPSWRVDCFDRAAVELGEAGDASRDFSVAEAEGPGHLES